MCDMGARQVWGRKKWASLHLLRYTAPQCLLFLLELSHIICATAYIQRLSSLMACVYSMSVSKSDLWGLTRFDVVLEKIKYITCDVLNRFVSFST